MHAQIATNAEAARWLADVLDGWGLDDVGNRAEWVVRELVGRGVRPVPEAPPLRPGRLADPDHRKAMKAEIDAAIARSRQRSRAALEESGGGAS